MKVFVTMNYGRTRAQLDGLVVPIPTLPAASIRKRNVIGDK
jgi:hypothetical protein